MKRLPIRKKRSRKPAGYRKMLGVDTNAKTIKESGAKKIKGKKRGKHLIGILYLAPSDTSGVMNTCGNETDGCKSTCLFKQGRAAIHKSINIARINKTLFLHANPAAALASLAWDIEGLIFRARKLKLKPAVRINGTSDIPKIARELAIMFPEVIFYDYTKHPRPWLRELSNYKITFSHSEENLQDCLQALTWGVNVAVVFDTKKGKPLPETWWGYPVIDGDTHDKRFLDPKTVVVGLRAKGTAKKDCSGFVVRVNQQPQLINIAPMKNVA
jgi:hypothetical protein